MTSKIAWGCLKILENPNHHKKMRRESTMNIFASENDGKDPQWFLNWYFLLTTDYENWYFLEINPFLFTQSWTLPASYEPQLFVNLKDEGEEKATPFQTRNFERGFYCIFMRFHLLNEFQNYLIIKNFTSFFIWIFGWIHFFNCRNRILKSSKTVHSVSAVWF